MNQNTVCRHRISWPLTALLALLWVSLVAGCSAGSEQALKPKVLSFSPGKATDNLREELRIQFDSPMVEEGEVGQEVKRRVSISPEVPIKVVYVDRQTLSIQPLADLQPATAYVVTLLRDRKKGIEKQEFQFHVQPLTVVDCRSFDAAMSPLQPKPVLVFNQEVAAADIEKHCHFRQASDARDIPLGAEVVALEAGAFQYRVAPKQALKTETRYTLRCEGLTSKSGTSPMMAPWTLDFTTHARLSVQKATPTGTDAWSDEVHIRLHFSTPVELSAVSEAVSATPAIPGLSRGTLNPMGTEYTAIVNLKSQTKYRIKVAKGLSDIFGQSLDSAFSHEFTTGSSRPRFQMQTGIFALEAGLTDAFPFWTRNLPRYSVACAAVPQKDIVKLLTGEMNYDPWYDTTSSKALDWTRLKLKVQRTTQVVDQPKDRWDMRPLPLSQMCGGTQSKLYLAEMSSTAAVPDPECPWCEDAFRRVLINHTDLGVLLKAGTQSGLMWVTRLSDGAVVSGAKVAVYTPEGTRFFSGTTDAQGLVKLPGIDSIKSKKTTGEYEDEWRSRRLIAIVEHGNDMAVVDGNWQNGIQIWNFGVDADYSARSGRYRAFIQSDRGIYRPGETAHFKGLVRKIELGKSPQVPKGEKVAVQVNDVRGNEIFKKTIALSKFGGFGFDIELGASVATGDYEVVATIGKEVFRESFMVEEFRKVTFSVGLAGEAPKGKSQRTQMTVSADYLFGMPVTDAKVYWSVMSRDHSLRFDRYPNFSFEDEASRGWEYYWMGFGGNEEHVADGSGQTDSQGRHAFSFDAKKDSGQPLDYLVSAEVQAENGETVRKSRAITVHRSSHYLGLHTQEWIQAVDMPFSVASVALTPAGKAVAARATISWNKQVWNCRRYDGDESSSCKTESYRRWSQEIDIPASGQVETRVVPDEPGEYVVRLEGKDANGLAIAASSYVWVIGKGEAFWSGDESVRMGIILSKDSYNPGEVAKVVPRASISAKNTLVTLERNGIMEAWVQPVQSAGQGIEIPVTDALAPNVFVNVSMVAGRQGEGDAQRPQFQTGVAEMKVDMTHKRLQVAVTPEKGNYAPGDKVRVRIKTTNADAPVPTELSISVADEGVLQLINYKTPDPMRPFYAPFGLGVEYATNWNRILRHYDPEHFDPDQGGDSGAPGDDAVRSRFLSSAFWTSALVTDAKGEASFEFVAPDNLTTFRIMAVAADDGARFGSGQDKILVNKKLMAQPLLPRFFTEGDDAQVGVEVHNRTEKAGEVSIRVTAQGAQLGQSEFKHNLGAGEKVLVRTSAKIPKDSAAEATFTFSAKMGAHSDAVAMTIPVQAPRITEQREMFSGTVQDKAQFDISKAQAGERNRVLRVELDRSGMARFAPSLSYLITYPYGCLEQVMSRVIPMVNLKEMAAALQLEQTQAKRMDEFIQAGIDKVLAQQSYDGHFSFWPGSRTYPHLTAFALFGLLEAKQAGVRIPKKAIDDAAKALKEYANSTDPSRLDPYASPTEHQVNAAMSAWVLARAGHSSAALNTRLYEVRAALPVVGQAFLLMSLRAVPQQAHLANTLRDELRDQVVIRDGSAIVKERVRMPFIMNSDVRSTAVVLMALAAEDGTAAQVQALRKGLDGARSLGGAWTCTQDNLWALTALSEVARRQSASDLTYTLTLDGKAIKNGTLRGMGVLIDDIPLSASGDAAKFAVQVNGKAELAVRVISERSDNMNAPQHNGLQVVRRYRKPGTDEPVGTVRVGDLVAVSITVTTPTLAHYGVVVDALPAGFEPVNPELAVHGDATFSSGYSDYALTYQELRDSQAQAFYDRLRQGTHTYTYQVRALTPGTFTAMPARVHLMYEPAINGRTAADTIVIK